MRTALTGLGDQPEDQKLDRSKRVPLHDRPLRRPADVSADASVGRDAPQAVPSSNFRLTLGESIRLSVVPGER